MKRKKSFLAALVLGAAFAGIGCGSAIAESNSYTIDGSEYVSGSANAGLTEQITVTKNDSSTIEGSWNADNGDSLSISSGTLEISGYDGSTNALTNGIITATGGNITATDGILTIGTSSSIASEVVLGGAGSLNINGGSVVLDSNDTLTGSITNTIGTLTLSEFTKTSSINQVGGTTNVLQSLSMESTDSITGGKFVVGNSTTQGNLNVDVDGTAASYDITNGSLTVSDEGSISLGNTSTWGSNGSLINDGGEITLNGIEKSGVYTQETEGSTLNVYQNASLASGDSITKGTLVIGDGSSKAGSITTEIALGADVIKTINSNGVLSVKNETTVVDVDDTWNGAISLTGADAKLELNGRSDTTTETKTYNQTDGTLTIDNGGSLTLNTATSSITGGSVVLGAEDDTAGSLVVNNGLTTNQAKVTIEGTSDSNALTVKGANTTLTLSDGSDIKNGTVTVGDADAKTANILTMAGDTNGSKIDSTVTMVVNEGAKVDITGGKSELTINDGDTWNGTINQTKGTLTFLDSVVKNENTATLTSTGGTVNIGDGTNAGTLTLNNDNDSIANTTEVVLNSDSTLAMSKGSVVLNSGDTWDGDISQSGGTLTFLDNLTKGDDATLKSDSGSIVIGDVASDPNVSGTLNLNNTDDYIETETAVTINSNGTLNQSDGSVVLDGTNDTWDGAISLSNNGQLELIDRNDTTDNTKTYTQSGGALTLTNSTLSLADTSKISGGDLTVDTKSTFNSLSNAFSVDNLTNAGLINGINGGYENYAVSTGLYAGDGISDNQGDFTVDLYARSRSNYGYDTFGSDSATISAANGTDGVLNVSDWHLNGDLYGWDAPIDRSYDVTKLFKGSVEAGQTIDFTTTNKEVFTPIGWYGLHSAGNGNYTFALNRYNPGVFRGQVSTIAQYQNQLMIDDMLFNHTMLDQGFKGNDYVASHPNRLASASDLYPPYQYSRKDGGLWIKMYGTFEKLNMSQGLHVGNNAYGTIIGADFGLKELKHGWQFMPTAYIAYNGAHQYWKGYGAYQNGGQAGFLGTWYKDNFMIGALAYGGVYGNDMDTPRGTDDAFNYFAGGSVKAAYNWQFARDWALQPNLLVAYNYFGQQNWHTDFGQMGMMSGMLHGVNVAPGLNLIWEKETFSIYGTLQYMYNVNQSTGGRAGDVYLPRVSMDRGYIQYGLGVNKKFSDRFSGYLQAVIRNVGRNGIGLQLGFNCALGNDGKSATKGYTPQTRESRLVLNYKKGK